jgi:hypothetical protein
LETPISHGILILSMKNELIFLRKMRIPWEIEVSKLALRITLFSQEKHWKNTGNWRNPASKWGLSF